MSLSNWVIYGATGYTGERIAREAVARGLSPILAGRSKEKLQTLADELSLDFHVHSLDDSHSLCRALADVALVVNAAGPFIHTAKQMRAACIASVTHYIDISGEIDVLSASLAANEAAKTAGVLCISGAGFDVVPSDCLAAELATKINNPSRLSVALIEEGRLSKGTLASILHQVPKGFFKVLQGKLAKIAPGANCITVDLGFAQHHLMPLPWGDLITAQASTGIENIITYAGMPKVDSLFFRVMGPVLHLAYKWQWLLNWRLKLLASTYKNPTPAELATAKSYIWVRVENDNNQSVEGLLQTADGYAFTQHSIIEAVLEVLTGEAKNLTGAMTPAQAFGMKFVERIPGVKRLY
ncbi:MAG: saccharopine dehydrogenase NADP-binding domain-containing protein [Alcanivoracaceae bacterium]|nr:saccharopine dehydrogenase NADP-binding domain-containing protein [Alcanivoracaceae bacterium]